MPCQRKPVGTEVLVLLAAAWLPTPSHGQTAETPDTVVLEYAPADKSMFAITETFTRQTAAGEPDPVVDKRERTGTLQVARVTEGPDESYANLLTVTSQTLKRNDLDIPSPVNAAMMGLTLTYKLSKEGRLTSITGYEGLAKKMRDRFGKQVADTMIRLLSIEALKLGSEKSYKALYEGLIGKSVTVGATSVSAHAQPLPYGGSKTVYAVESSTRDMDGTLKLTRTYNSDATALADAFDSVEAATLEMAETEAGVTDMLPENHASASVAGTWETAIDPSGLLIESHAMTMAYTLTLNDPDGGGPTSVTITDASSFEVVPVIAPPMESNSQPSFGDSTVANQTYDANRAISALTLPVASGGDGPLAYNLSPDVPGLNFNASTRVLAGTPTAAGTYSMTYSVTEADGDSATLNFVVTVAITQMTTIDLIVASVSASDDTPAPGQSFDLTATTSNRGTGASADTTLRFYRSADSTISTGDTQVGTAAVSALSAGGTSSETITVTAPSAAGTYHYGACVDLVPGESNIQNNCSIGVPLTVLANQTGLR